MDDKPSREHFHNSGAILVAFCPVALGALLLIILMILMVLR